MPVPERSAPTELVLCVQSDAVDDGAFERLIGHVRRTVGASGIPRERVRYVEALPGGDFAGYDRLRDLVAEDGCVPFKIGRASCRERGRGWVAAPARDTNGR